jgi:hypothetical protein
LREASDGTGIVDIGCRAGIAAQSANAGDAPERPTATPASLAEKASL